MERALVRYSQKELGEDISKLTSVAGLWDLLSKVLLSKSIRPCVRREAPQFLSIKALPTRTCTDVQPQALTQMKCLWSLVLSCFFSRFVILNRLLLSYLNPITTKKLQRTYNFNTTKQYCTASTCCGLIQCSVLTKKPTKYGLSQDHRAKLTEQNMI